MRNPQRGVLVLALALGGLLGAEAADLRDGTVTLGGVTVALPAPVGFRPLTTETAVTKAMSPDGPRRLATFYSDSDLDRALRGQKDGAALAFNRWYMASVSRELENVRATLREFQEFKEEYRGQQVQLITQSTDRGATWSRRYASPLRSDGSRRREA